MRAGAVGAIAPGNATLVHGVEEERADVDILAPGAGRDLLCDHRFSRAWGTPDHTGLAGLDQQREGCGELGRAQTVVGGDGVGIGHVAVSRAVVRGTALRPPALVRATPAATSVWRVAGNRRTMHKRAVRAGMGGANDASAGPGSRKPIYRVSRGMRPGDRPDRQGRGRGGGTCRECSDEPSGDCRKPSPHVPVAARQADRLGNDRNRRHPARGGTHVLRAGAGLFRTRHGAVGEVRCALPAPGRGIGQAGEPIFGQGHARTGKRRETALGRGTLLVPDGFQLQARCRPAACCTGRVGATSRQSQPDGARGRSGRGPAVAG